MILGWLGGIGERSHLGAPRDADHQERREKQNISITQKTTRQ